jgi:hypothetical protein
MKRAVQERTRQVSCLEGGGRGPGATPEAFSRRALVVWILVGLSWRRLVNL